MPAGGDIRDRGGRLIRRKVQGRIQNLGYDGRNRLTRWDWDGSAGTSCTYDYDHAGRRILTRETVGGATKVTRYVYDGADVCAEYEDSDDDGDVDRTRVYWLLPGMDRRIGFAENVNGTTSFYYYLTDQVGTVLRIVKEDGTVVNQYDYDAFGRVRQASSSTFVTVENRYLFQGREWDKNGGFYYFRNRIYLPERGEFASPDMNLGRGILGELDGMATLTFCGGDPVNMIDPTGLEIIYSGTEEEIALLKSFREAISKGSISGRALMDRLDVKGFTVKFQFKEPPGSTTYKGLTVKKEQFGVRAVPVSSTNKQKVDRPLYSSDVYLNKDLFKTKEGKTDLNLAFATFIHESVHAYDNASKADIETEKDRPELTRLLSPPKEVRAIKDVESYGKISGWTTLFEDSDPIREYRAIRGVRGIRTEAGDLYRKLIKENKTSSLDNHFGIKQEYVNLLWMKMPLESYTEHKGAPLPELIKMSDGDATIAEVNKPGRGIFYYRYKWE